MLAITATLLTPNYFDVVRLHKDSICKVLANLIAAIGSAVRNRASDIHLEPTIKKLQIRDRIDGVLRNVTKLPSSLADGALWLLRILYPLQQIPLCA